MEAHTLIIIVVIGVIALLTFCIIGLYNKIINSKNIVNDKWEEINNQLSNKEKLISKIIELIKENLNKEDLNILMETKNKLINSKTINDKIKTNVKINNILGSINNEYNKVLKDNSKYKELNKQLKEIEDKIDYAKEFYNEVASKHNKLIKKFPLNIVSLLFNFKVYTLFEQ